MVIEPFLVENVSPDIKKDILKYYSKTDRNLSNNINY